MAGINHIRTARKGSLYVAALAVAVFCCVPVFVDSSSSETTTENISLNLVNSEGLAISSALFYNAEIVYDTETDANGTRYFMQAVSVGTIPAKLGINAAGGTFNVSVKAAGIEALMHDYDGLRIKAGSFVADLNEGNGYSSDFMDNSEKAAFEAGTQYPISVHTLGGSSTSAPVDPNVISFTFGWSTSESTRIVTFVSENQVKAYMTIAPGDTITAPPSVSLDNHRLVGWIDPDGNMVEFPYTPEDNVVLTAKWEYHESFPLNWIPLCIIPIAGVLLFILLKKRKANDEPEVVVP